MYNNSPGEGRSPQEQAKEQPTTTPTVAEPLLEQVSTEVDSKQLKIPVKPSKPDYLPLSSFRRPKGPSVYAGAAAADDVAKGLLVSDAMHDMTFYTEVSKSLPDAGQPVLNSVFFSQRHIVNDSPSIEEEIAQIDSNIRLWRSSRLQQVLTKYDHDKTQHELDKEVSARIRKKEENERNRTLRRIDRMLDTLLPKVQETIDRISKEKYEHISAKTRETLDMKDKQRSETHRQVLRDMHAKQRQRLVERQYQKNMQERVALDTKHYFSYMEIMVDLRRSYLLLQEAFHELKKVVGVVEDEGKLRQRMEKNEQINRGDILQEMERRTIYLKAKRHASAVPKSH
ncbi:paraflagellar rod protein [Trypanosoma brucei equiperdum]|uniref:Paraflagellar rod protein n=1 Tax=Trypanosoma brucei equiperdum TaxID=630700 RepID=A0A3L6KZ49_9TRYP|nr:paraflagellar rod protein [Trypanosoma brucei equiperdum]